MSLFDGWGDAIGSLFSSGPEQLSGPGAGSFDWGSLGSSIGSGFGSLAKEAAGPLAGGLAGLAINKMMPGKEARPVLVDTRQGVTRAGADMAMDRAKNIQQNPTSFGLPGDPNDPSTPAGKKRYDITKSSRDADAARGMFNTGGSAARETGSLNTAIGNEYNKVWGDSMNTLSGQPQMQGYMAGAEENPWAKIVAGAVSPAVSKGLSSLLAEWGMGA